MTLVRADRRGRRVDPWLGWLAGYGRLVSIGLMTMIWAGKSPDTWNLQTLCMYVCMVCSIFAGGRFLMTENQVLTGVWKVLQNSAQEASWSHFCTKIVSESLLETSWGWFWEPWRAQNTRKLEENVIFELHLSSETSFFKIFIAFDRKKTCCWAHTKNTKKHDTWNLQTLCMLCMYVWYGMFNFRGFWWFFRFYSISIDFWEHRFLLKKLLQNPKNLKKHVLFSIFSIILE